MRLQQKAYSHVEVYDSCQDLGLAVPKEVFWRSRPSSSRRKPKPKTKNQQIQLWRQLRSSSVGPEPKGFSLNPTPSIRP